jgi:hypothetical protein
VLLRCASRREGKDFDALEVAEIYFDERFGEDVFTSREPLSWRPCELPKTHLLLGGWVNSGPRPGDELLSWRSAPPLLVSVQDFAECRLLAGTIVVHERGHHASVLP